MEIRIDGAIVRDSDKWLYDWFGEPAVSPKSFRAALPENPLEPLVVWINSLGGDMSAGSVIYAMLKEWRGDVTIKIDGDAVSAASLIAMGARRVLMSPLGMMMIHRVWTVAQGNAEALDQAKQMLDEADEAAMNAYELKTGLPREQIYELMAKETWMSAARAIELGFADGMLYQDESASELTGLRAASITTKANALFDRAKAMLELEKHRYT